MPKCQSNNASYFPRLIFLSQIVDAQGRVTTLNYDTQNRLTNVTGATHQSLKFNYQDSNNTYLITQITDHTGRNVQLSYDSVGRLQSITDALGMATNFSYDSGSFINA